MRKLLNTVYVTLDDAYLRLDNENLVCSQKKEVLFRIPIVNIENIVCFSYLGCSPELMGACVERNIPINFIAPTGKFWARVVGMTTGNIYLRVAQIDKFRENKTELCRNTVLAKAKNSVKVIKRTLHDHEDMRTDTQIAAVLEELNSGMERLMAEVDVASILGIEGNCARAYFSVFGKLITHSAVSEPFEMRTKRPPLDPVNAVLSFLYTLATNDYASALEVVGLDSYYGFYHAMRSGRTSLACDLVEETRCIVERFTISQLNLHVLTDDDFERQVSGAVLLNNDGRKKVLQKWQEKKREEVVHPYLKQKIPLGLLPYVQANLLAKYVRGDLDMYPPFLL